LLLVVVVALAAPAGAEPEHHFTVADLDANLHQTSLGFRISGDVIDPRRGGKAGHERVRCYLSGPNEATCLGVVHLNGRVGGAGLIRFTGDIGSDDRRLHIKGGTRDFETARGKVTMRGLNTPKTRFRFYLRPGSAI
jgi:hypothetical protein